MTLDPQTWRHHCPDVAPGRKARVEHDCGTGRTLIVSNGDEGYSAWCFRCNDKGFIPHPAPTLAERLARLVQVRSAEDEATASPALPEPRVTDPQLWPDQPRVWLYKAGFSNDDIIALGAYWNPRLSRVVMPVMRDGEVVYWQARGFIKERAKYINPPIDRATLCAKYPGRRHASVLVLTEDMLSAYRVARLTTAWSIMGTVIPPAVALDAVQQGLPIIVMLDPDAAGRKGASNVTRALRDLGGNVAVATAPRDPKYLTIEDTKQCILSANPSLATLLP